ncbi:hypothetical protein O181_035260, partial [Austropuccinia psidii MF-1]|nr:hypothetical protein [Austropuccinia psidii MF-1]
MAKYPKRHFINSESSKIQVSLLSSWHHSKRPLATFNPQEIYSFISFSLFFCNLP